MGGYSSFNWPKTKNPLLWLVRLFGRSTLFIVLGLIYIFQRLGITSKLPILIIFTLLFFSLGWVCMQQELKVYRILGWVVIGSTIFMLLVELFPETFSITLF